MLNLMPGWWRWFGWLVLVGLVSPGVVWAQRDDGGDRALAPDIDLPDVVELARDPDASAFAILPGGHPSLSIQNLRPADRRDKVSGLAFLPDGRLVMATWRPGEVWLIEGVEREDPATHVYTRIAAGLSDPMGVSVVEGRVLVLHKPGFVVLTPDEADGSGWSREDWPGGWAGTGNHHEFAFGGAYHDGGLFVALSTGIDGRGRSFVPQAAGRGSLVRFDVATRELATMATGLRAPNGVMVEGDGTLWFSDNQGDYLPTSKLVRIGPGERGGFYGYAAVLDEAAVGLEETRPTVWLPHREAGRSPSQMVRCRWEPWAGQVLLGDVTLGGVRRVQVEAVDGVWQGCVFRFTQGFEAGVNRLCWGPDGALYVGGIGSRGDWGQPGKRYFGLARARYRGGSGAGAGVFEMRRVHALADGFEVVMSEAADEAARGAMPVVTSWRYETTVSYGGPKLDMRDHRVASAAWSADGLRLRLRLAGGGGAMPEGRVYRIALPTSWRSVAGRELWSRHAWYTLNRRPGA